MPVSEQTPIQSYLGNGATTLFAFAFVVLAADDLVVLVNDALGVSHLKVLNVDYTVAGVGSGAGGSVTFVTAPATGETVVVYRDSGLSRATDYQEGGDLLSGTLDNDLDRLWLALQEIFNGGKGPPTALRVPNGETVPALVNAAARANRTLGFDALGAPTVLTPVAGSAASVLTDLASSVDVAKGAALSGFGPTLTYPTATVGGAIRQRIFAALHVSGSDTNFGQTLNRAIQYAVTTYGGGVVDCPAGGALTITTKVLIPTGVILNLNGCRITGGGIGFGTPMFESAYVSSGTVTTNVGTSPETHPTLGGGVVGGGATITSAGTVFNLFNFLDNCIIEGIEFNDCTKPILASRCFYMTVRRCFSRGTASATAEAAFDFTGFNNVITLESVFVVGRTLAAKFSGGTFGLVIKTCSAESCTTGLQFEGTVQGLTIIGNYFESTVTALNFANTGGPSYVGIDIVGNWFNLCTTALVGVTMQGTWRRSNVFNTGANAVTLSNVNNLMCIELELMEASDNGTPSIPANFTLGTKCWLDGLYSIFSSGTGIPTNKTFQVNDKAPFQYHGDCGTPVPNIVAFHTHAKTAGTTFDVQVTTSITFQAAAMIGYWLEIVDNVGTYDMYGRVVNGTVVKADDASGKTVTASNSGGFLRLTATSFTHPGSTYTCKGVVRHL